MAVDFGFVQMQIGPGTYTGYGTTNIRKVLQGIKDAGGTRVRIAAWWNTLQSTAGTGPSGSQWDGLDQAVTLSTEYGLTPLITITSPEPAAGTPTVANYADLCGKIAARYGAESTNAPTADMCHHYEVWNEANHAGFSTPFPLGAATYTPLLIAASNAIRAADSEAVVVATGLMPLSSTHPSDVHANHVGAADFLQGIYDNGGQGFFDVIAYHWYTHAAGFGAYEAPTESQVYYEELIAMRAVAVAAGDAAVPFWITEMGIPSLTVTDIVQRTNWLMTQINMLLSLDWVDTFFIYNYRDTASDGTQAVNTFGAVTFGFSPKTAYLKAITEINNPPPSDEPAPSYTQSPFSPQVHKGRGQTPFGNLDQDSQTGLRGKLIESIMQIVVQALTGAFIPGFGTAFQQLQSWATGIADALTSIPIIGPFIEWLAALFGVDLGEVGDPDVNPAAIWGNVTNIFIKPLNAFAGLIGGLIPSSLINILDPSKILGLPGNLNSILSGFNGIFSAWFGTPSGAATIADAVPAVETTVEAIRAAVAGGYTLQTFTASDAAWAVPPELLAAAEAYAGAFGGGGRGVGGQELVNNTSGFLRVGGAGGSSGGYKIEKFDPATLGASLVITIGLAASTAGADGGQTIIANGATQLAISQPGVGAIASPQGYVNSSSLPGAGGRGGDATTGGTATDGEPGESSAAPVSGMGVGGSGGNGVASGSTNAAGGWGGNGAAGQGTNVPMTGGGGGGGGGGARVSAIGSTAFGGKGGNGGFPGGGSGGGGAAVGGNLTSVQGGLGGPPANGLAFLLWR